MPYRDMWELMVSTICMCFSRLAHFSGVSVLKGEAKFAPNDSSTFTTSLWPRFTACGAKKGVKGIRLSREQYAVQLCLKMCLITL